MNKSLVILSALTVAVLTWYIGERFYSSPATSKPAVTQTDPAQVVDALATAQTKQQSDATRLQALLKGQNAAALAAAQLAVTNAQADLSAAIDDEYTQAYDAIYNKTDFLFTDPKTNARINITTQSLAIQTEINAARQNINSLVGAWQPSDASVVLQYLNQLKSIVAALTPDDSGLTQADIDAYQAAVDSASIEVNDAITKVDAAQAAANLANDELLVQQLAGDPNAIENEEQTVAQDQAQVAALEAQLAADQTTQDTSDDTSDVGNSGTNGPSYSYGTGNVQQQQANFQEILKNGPPELMQF